MEGEKYGNNEFMKKRLSKSIITIEFANKVSLNAKFLIDKEYEKIWKNSEIELRKELEEEGYDKDWIEKEISELEIPSEFFGELLVMWDREIIKLERLPERKERDYSLDKRLKEVFSLLKKYEI